MFNSPSNSMMFSLEQGRKWIARRNRICLLSETKQGRQRWQVGRDLPGASWLLGLTQREGQAVMAAGGENSFYCYTFHVGRPIADLHCQVILLLFRLVLSGHSFGITKFTNSI